MQNMEPSQLVLDRRPPLEPVPGIVFAAQSARVAFTLGRFMVNVVRETAFQADPITFEPHVLQRAA